MRAQGREAWGCASIPAAAPQQPVTAPAAVTPPALGTGASPSPTSTKPMACCSSTSSAPRAASSASASDQGHHGGKGPRHSPQERGRSLEASGGWDVLCPNLSWGIGMRQAGDRLLPGNRDPPGKVGVLPPTFSLFLVFVSGLEPHLAPRLSTGMMGGSQCGRRLPAPKSPMPPFHPAGH